MYITMIVVSLLLGALLTYAAVRKLSGREAVIAEYRRVGVSEKWLRPLAGLLLLATLGIAGGLFWRPLGILTAAALCFYFVSALAAHVRAGDFRNMVTPLAIWVLAGLLLILRMHVR